MVTPMATTARVSPPMSEKCSSPVASSCSPPTAGSSQPLIQLLSSSPLTTEAAPSSSSGTVITSGDSCGCTPGCQRFLPKKVSSITRVM